MRVGIVNDQRLATEALRRVILSDPHHAIAWEAADGEEALRRCREDLPDVVLMDLVMPGLNGAETTRRLMAQTPVAILVVTSGVQTNFSLVCEALGHGAYDAVGTPVIGSSSPALAGADLLAKLHRVDQVNRRLRGTASTTIKSPPVVSSTPRHSSRLPLIAIGVSTGGPPALAAVLMGFPADLPAGVVIVQHMSPEHLPDLINWLQSRTSLPVKAACQGQRPERGGIVVACSGDHLVIQPDGTYAYTAEPRDYPYRPSADVLFHSLAAHWPTKGAAALLTGIGRDGAEGLLALRRAGWKTVAQDEATSVVHGMPKAAVQIGAAAAILPLDHIGSYLARQITVLPTSTS